MARPWARARMRRDCGAASAQPAFPAHPQAAAPPNVAEAQKWIANWQGKWACVPTARLAASLGRSWGWRALPLLPLAPSDPPRLHHASAGKQAAMKNRPSWFPGSKLPDHLDGSMPGDYGFDPLGLALNADNLRW